VVTSRAQARSLCTAAMFLGGVTTGTPIDSGVCGLMYGYRSDTFT
jgi:hypothetical protein